MMCDPCSAMGIHATQQCNLHDYHMGLERFLWPGGPWPNGPSGTRLGVTCIQSCWGMVLPLLVVNVCH